MDLIVKYLEMRELPLDKNEALKLSTKVVKFTLVDGKLYRKVPLQRCLTEEEVEYVMKEIYEVIYRTHIRSRALSNLVVRQGYFWPTMKQDAINFVRKCDVCQRYTNLVHSSPTQLSSIQASWPFVQWELISWDYSQLPQVKNVS